MSNNTCKKPGLYCCNLALESSSTVSKHDLGLNVREVGEASNFEQNLKFEYSCPGFAQSHLADVGNYSSKAGSKEFSALKLILTYSLLYTTIIPLLAGSKPFIPE